MADVVGIGAAVGGVAGSVGGISQAVGSVISKLIEFAKDVLMAIITIARRFAEWYMNLLKEDPLTAAAIALVVGYWLSPY